MTRLFPLDASFLRVETPAAHMHIGWLATLDRPARTSALHVVSRLAGGRAAVVGKVHHAMVGTSPPPVQARAAHLAASPRLYNLTVSNLPGPQVPLYAAGGRVRTIHPLIPIPDRHASAVGSISCGDELGLAAYADPAALRGLGRWPVLFADALAELGPARVGRRADRGRAVAA